MSRTYPSTYEAPVFRLLKYAFFIGLFGFFLGVMATVIFYRTNWWQQLGMATLNFHLVNPWFFLIYGGFGTVAVLYYRFEHGKKRKQQKQRKLLAEHGLALLNEERK